MSSFIEHISEIRFWLAFLGCAIVACCATSTAQQTTTETATDFEVAGRVVSKTKYGFEVQTKGGEVIEVAVNESTDIALRMSSPWFDAKNRKVVVDGKSAGNGKRERISYSLPEGKLYLLAQFRSLAHRRRIFSQSSWRLNNYLISDQPIDSALPTGNELLLAGELDIENSQLVIEDKSFPIILGFRSATLRGRSFADIIAGETVVLVSGSESGGAEKTANTILFMIR